MATVVIMPRQGQSVESCIITSWAKKVGDEVKAGDTVVVLEAMKMANNLDAETDGKVTAVLVKEGDSVMEDTPLVVIE